MTVDAVDAPVVHDEPDRSQLLPTLNMCPSKVVGLVGTLAW